MSSLDPSHNLDIVGGEFFCSNLGRPLLGCEKLLVQGIPYFRLALGSETEVELGDLAGNAMR